MPHSATSFGATPSAYHGWQIVVREGTGTFVAGPSGTLLFRIDQKAGLIFPWDKRNGREIAIPLAALQGLSLETT